MDTGPERAETVGRRRTCTRPRLPFTLPRWGHQPDFSGGFPARILIPPCRDQNPRLAPRLVEHADDLLQLVLCDSCVHRRRLNVRVPALSLANAGLTQC